MAGVETCGSVWACPVCAAKVGARRAAEVAAVIEWAGSQGHSVALVTLTMRHHRGQTLEQCWDALGKAWGAVTSGRGWMADRQLFGVEGWVRAVEVTHGSSGWHVHIHALVVLQGAVDAFHVHTLGIRMFSRWQAALQRAGFDAWREHGGLDIRIGSTACGDRLGGYLVKSLAWEMVGGSVSKSGRRSSRTPFQILAEIFDEYLADDADLWWTFEAVSKGRRQLTWSRGLRDRIRLGQEDTDEEVAAEEVGTSSDDVLGVDSSGWAQLEPVIDVLLSELENGGVAGALRWASARGLGGVTVVRQGVTSPCEREVIT